MLGFFDNVSWRESMVLVLVLAAFVGVRARKAIYRR